MVDYLFSDGGIIVGLVVGAIMALGTYVLGKAQATSEKYASVSRAKDPKEQTLIDKSIIEIDRRLDMLNIEQLEIFLRSYVAAHLDDVLKNVPVVGPAVVAANHVDKAFAEFRSRNPELANILRGMTKADMQGKLAGAMGDASKDVLKAALDKAMATRPSLR